MVSNPEFLKEGAAVEDFMRPDRVVIGADDERAIAAMRAVYAPFQRNHERLLVMDVRSAELTKYAANAMLATRISFMNELANLADALGADIEHVRQGIGSDPRIGCHFLYPGVGYGGSCFPKDVKALQHTATELGRPLQILGAVEAANEAQKLRLVEKIVARLGEDLAGRRFALWGLAFKPNTDDMREAPSREIIAALAARGAQRRRLRSGGDAGGAARVRRRSARRATPRRRWTALAGADALVVVTEWKEFRSPDFDALRAALKQPLVFDGRNLYEPALVRAAGLEYFSIGAAAVSRADAHESRMRRAPILGVARARRAHARAGGRRRDARPLLVRRRRADLARGAGAGGQGRAHRGAPRRGGQRRAQRGGAGRADDAAVRHRRRRAGRRARAPARGRARATSFHRDPALPTTVKLRVIGRQQQLLRIDFETAPSHEVLATKLADYDRLLAGCRPRDPVRLRQGRPRAHRDDDRASARRRQAGAGRPEGRRLGRATAAPR